MTAANTVSRARAVAAGPPDSINDTIRATSMTVMAMASSKVPKGRHAMGHHFGMVNGCGDRAKQGQCRNRCIPRANASDAPAKTNMAAIGAANAHKGKGRIFAWAHDGTPPRARPSKGHLSPQVNPRECGCHWVTSASGQP